MHRAFSDATRFSRWFADCIFWTEPTEAKVALAQAVQQRPASEGLAIGTIPLGKALALCEGWAEAGAGMSTTFQLRAHARVVQELRPLLSRQLEQQVC